MFSKKSSCFFLLVMVPWAYYLGRVIRVYCQCHYPAQKKDLAPLLQDISMSEFNITFQFEDITIFSRLWCWSQWPAQHTWHFQLHSPAPLTGPVMQQSGPGYHGSGHCPSALSSHWFLPRTLCVPQYLQAPSPGTRTVWRESRHDPDCTSANHFSSADRFLSLSRIFLPVSRCHDYDGYLAHNQWFYNWPGCRWSHLFAMSFVLWTHSKKRFGKISRFKQFCELSNKNVFFGYKITERGRSHQSNGGVLIKVRP